MLDMKERIGTMAVSEDLLVIKHAMEPLTDTINSRGRELRTFYRPSDVHFTAGRIYASLTPGLLEEDRVGLPNFSAEYPDVKKIKLKKSRLLDEHWLEVQYWSGAHHWWDTTDTSFRVTKEQFEELRSLLPGILGLSGKVEFPK